MNFEKNKYKMIIVLVLIIIIGVAGLLFFLNKKGVLKLDIIQKIEHNIEQDKKTETVNNPIATMEIEDYGTVKIELYPDVAPNTVKNFIALANNEFYDGLTFHRIVKDFIIQGGAYFPDIGYYKSNEDGILEDTDTEVDRMPEDAPFLSDIDNTISWKDSNDKQYAIKGEFSDNGYDNSLSHTEGVISMARRDYSSYGATEVGYNTAGTQFFIVTKDTPSIDGYYASFGKVIEGMDIVHKIENLETTDETPKNPPTITSIRVDTFGKEYGLPETTDVISIMSLFGLEDTTEKPVNTRLERKQETDKIKQENKNKKEFVQEVNPQLVSIAKQHGYNYISSEVWRTLSNKDYVILLSMSDPRYSLAKYYQLIEFDPNSKMIIKSSGLFNSDDRSIVSAEFIDVWGYNEGKGLLTY